MFGASAAEGREEWERRSLEVLLAKHVAADLSAFIPAYG
jgi:hypothetical protein